MNQKVQKTSWMSDMENLTVPIGLTPKIKKGETKLEFKEWWRNFFRY